MMRKYLCDQMCGELGQWLRAAGYDTVIIKTPIDDREILKHSIEEERLLLTRDRDFFELDPEKKVLIYLEGEFLEDWVQQLRQEGVDWLYCPFTRCLHCNTPFEKNNAPEKLLIQLPKEAQEYWFCPTCQQLFWLGSHTERMEEQLRNWKEN